MATSSPSPVRVAQGPRAAVQEPFHPRMRVERFSARAAVFDSPRARVGFETEAN